MDTFEREGSVRYVTRDTQTPAKSRDARWEPGGSCLPARTSAAAPDALRAGKEREERERAPKDGGHHHMGYMWSADGARARAATRRAGETARQGRKALQRGDR